MDLSSTCNKIDLGSTHSRWSWAIHATERTSAIPVTRRTQAIHVASRTQTRACVSTCRSLQDFLASSYSFVYAIFCFPHSVYICMKVKLTSITAELFTKSRSSACVFMRVINLVINHLCVGEKKKNGGGCLISDFSFRHYIHLFFTLITCVCVTT